MSIVLDRRDAVRRPISYRWLVASLSMHGLVLFCLMQFAGGGRGGYSLKDQTGDDSLVVTWIPGSGDDAGGGGGGGTDTVVEDAEPPLPAGPAPIEMEPEPERKPLLDVAENDPTKVFNDSQVAAFIVDPDSKGTRPTEPLKPQDDVDETLAEDPAPDRSDPQAIPSKTTSTSEQPQSNEPAGPGQGQGDQGSGNGPGKGAAAGNGKNGIKFFGIFARARKVVYVIDASESMKNHRAMEIARLELFQSLKGLEPTAQFQIIFFDSQPHVMNGALGSPKLLPASPRNVVQAEQFAKGIEPESGTDRLAAIQLALGFHPDVIFVLTDADDPKLRPQELFDIKKANKRRASINVVEFGVKADLSSDSFLKQLARENGGQHFYRDLTK